MSRLRSKGFAELTLLIYGGIAVGVVLLLGYVYHLGSSNKEAEMTAAFAKERVERQKMISDLALELGDVQQKRWNENKAHEHELQEVNDSWHHKEVMDRYVPKDPKRNCPVTNGWVQYHDERAAGLPAGPGLAPGVASAPSGIEETQALETVGDNYGLYYYCKERVRQITQRYDDVHDSINSAVNRMNKQIDDIERKLK